MRKGLLSTFVALFVAVGLTAVSSAQGSVDYESVDPSGQTVVFWHQHPNEREEALQAIVEDFNANNEYGITVVAEFQSTDYGEIFQKMLPLLGTDETPNLVVAYQNQAATYELADGLIDLTPLVESATWGLSADERSDFFEGFYNADVFPTFGGERLGFPPNRSMEVMYYNADWLNELREAGAVSFEGPPGTPDEFREAACAASETPFSGGAEGESIGFEFAGGASNFASWTFAFGGDIFDYEAGRYSYDSEGAVEALTFLQELVQEGCAALAVERFGEQADFGAGRALFTIASTSGLPFYKSAVDEGAGFEWSVTALPHTTPEPVQNIYGASVSIPAGHSPEADVATWLFLKHYTSPEAQAQWAQASNYFPVRQSTADGLGDYFAANPTYQTAYELLPFGKSEPPAPGYDFVRDMIEQETVAILDGGANVAETLEAANAEANLILEDQLADME